MNADEQPIIEPDFRVIRLEETDWWSDDIKKKLNGGKIFGVFLFDKNQVTHCCEITPSYCLHWICTDGEMGDGSLLSDELYEEITDVRPDDPVTYIHCQIIDKFPEDRFRKISFNEAYDPAKHDDRKAWYEDELELALDYARCNS